MERMRIGKRIRDIAYNKKYKSFLLALENESGSIGYIGFNGNIQTNIAIRTISISNETAYFNVGGGIVSDSDPEDEYMETLHKAKGMIQALSLHM